MPKKGSKKSLFQSPLVIDIEHAKTVEKKVLEIDPNRIKVGEVVIYKVSKWFGLKNECFAVMNVDGKQLYIEQLRSIEKKGKKKKRDKTKA